MCCNKCCNSLFTGRQGVATVLMLQHVESWCCNALSLVATTATNIATNIATPASPWTVQQVVTVITTFHCNKSTSMARTQVWDKVRLYCQWVNGLRVCTVPQLWILPSDKLVLMQNTVPRDQVLIKSNYDVWYVPYNTHPYLCPDSNSLIHSFLLWWQWWSKSMAHEWPEAFKTFFYFQTRNW